MDAYRTATPESRASGQRKVLAVTAGTGAAALVVTGLLTVGLGTTATSAATGVDTTTSNGTDTTTTDSGSGSVSSSDQAPVASSGGS